MSGIYKGHTVTIAGEYPVVKFGDRGRQVQILQALLGVDPDGDFGPDTEAAVISLQAEAGITVDGEAGTDTWSYAIAKCFSEVIT